MPISWSEFVRGTNGRRLSTPPWDILSTWLCLLACLTHLPFFSVSSMTCLEICWADLCLSTWMISSSFPRVKQNTSSMSVRSSIGSWRTACLSKQRSVFHASTVTFLGHIIARGQVRMDPEKVRAVLDWPWPDTRKQLQRFLGFANFYRCFIRNYSRTAAPLTALTSPARPFHWSSEAEGAFLDIKKRFTSAPILINPDSSRQFVVEVDASDVGVGAVLSQRSPEDNKLHPCAFLSHRLSPTERNYDVGNRELLAVKMALEEWRHWLEGVDQPFVVWTDHRNLEYIRSAKRLNPRQARWALFFGRFNFALTYRPGSRNVKPDALSRLFEKEETVAEPDTIIPRTCIIGAAIWEIEGEVRTALQNQPDPGNAPTAPPVCASLCPSICITVGSLLLTLMPSWSGSHFGLPAQTILVARDENRSPDLCLCLSRLCTEQRVQPPSSRVPAAAAHTSSPVVSPVVGFCIRATTLERYDCGLYCGGSF